MARFRQVGNFISFAPPDFLTGIGQAVDCWGGLSSDTAPPRIQYVKKASSSQRLVRSGRYAVVDALKGDVRKIGSDIFRCIQKYDVEFEKNSA